MMQQRLKQQQQQAMMQQQSLYHPGLLAPPQIEPILSGNLPPGFDSSACRSVYVGNIHPQVTEPLLQEVFSSTGPLEGCKLIKKEKAEMVMPNDSVFSASHGFVRTGIGKSRGQGICILPIAQWRKVLV